MIKLRSLKISKFIFTIFLSCLGVACFAVEAVDVEADLGREITKKISVLKGLSSQIPEDINLSAFEKAGKEIKLNYTNDPVGMYLSLKPSASSKSLVLVFNHSLSGRVQVFRREGEGQWKRTFITGSEIPYKDRVVKGYHLAIPLQPASVPVGYLLIRTSHHRFDAKASLMTKDEFVEGQQTLKSYYFFYLGCLYSLIFYNLFLFFGTREINYFFYCCFGFTISLTVLSVTGFVDDLFSFLNYSLSQHLILFSSLSLVFAIKFASSFCLLKQYSPKIEKVTRYISFGCLAIFIASIGPWDKALGGAHLGTIIDILLPLGIILMFAGAVNSFRKGYVMARFYLASWIFMFGGSLIYFGHYAGIFERNLLTSHGVVWGNVLEMIIVSLGLAYKISILDREKKEALIMAKGKREYERLVRVLLHDIGNPLNLINYYVNLKLKNPDHFDRLEEKAWDKISLGSKKINEIIDFHRHQESNLSQKNNTLVLEPIELCSVIKEVEAIFEEALDQKKLTLNLDKSGFPEGEEILILAERVSLINEVVNNLISNAIKFSYEGGVIDVSCEIDTENVVLKIKDQGKGMSTDQLKKFVESGSLESQIGTHGERGSGFGLYLAKSYLELYGGKFNIQSTSISTDRRNHGTTYYLTFNRAKA